MKLILPRLVPLLVLLALPSMKLSAKDSPKAAAPTPASTEKAVRSGAHEHEDEPRVRPTPASTEKAVRSARLNHVVSFKFKEGASKEQIREVEEAFRALKTKIPQIQKLHWGMNNSPEGLNKGFTHCWVLTFATDADRDAYLVHPDHKEFGKRLKPVLADVFVIDFWAKD